MITRYLNNRWWKMKESPDGQYVAYHDHEAQIEKLRYENDKLWERIAQQVEEQKVLLESKTGWVNMATASHVEIMELRKKIKLVKKLIITALLAIAWALLSVGYSLWH